MLAVFALNFNALFTEYDMSATFHSSYGKTYAMVIQNMCAEEGRDGYNVNASGRRCASTVFIMLVSGLILYLVYGVGARDLADRLALKEKRRKRREKLVARFGEEKRPQPSLGRHGKCHAAFFMQATKRAAASFRRDGPFGLRMNQYLRLRAASAFFLRFTLGFS